MINMKMNPLHLLDQSYRFLKELLHKFHSNYLLPFIKEHLFPYVKENWNWLTIFGFLITFAYFYFVYKLVEVRLPKIETMDLNNLGDFFAGVLGPLALFWFIIGYFQQGKELRQQARELNRLVESERENLDFEKKKYHDYNKTKFVFIKPECNIENYRCKTIVLTTNIVTSVEIIAPDDRIIIYNPLEQIPLCTPEGRYEFEWQFTDNYQDRDYGVIKVLYNRNGYERITEFDLMATFLAGGMSVDIIERDDYE